MWARSGGRLRGRVRHDQIHEDGADIGIVHELVKLPRHRPERRDREMPFAAADVVDAGPVYADPASECAAGESGLVQIFL